MTDGIEGAPVPPPERFLAQVAAQVDLLRYEPGVCPHCKAMWVPISFWPGSTVVRATELRHEDGCPALDD